MNNQKSATAGKEVGVLVEQLDEVEKEMQRIFRVAKKAGSPNTAVVKRWTQDKVRREELGTKVWFRDYEEIAEKLKIEQRFVYENIDPDLLAKDENGGLSINRYRTYGPMSGLEATEYFCFCMGAVFKKAECLPIVHTYFAANSEKALDAIWRARQKADELGLGYLEYLFSIGSGHTRRKPGKKMTLGQMSGRAAAKDAMLLRQNGQITSGTTDDAIDAAP